MPKNEPKILNKNLAEKAVAEVTKILKDGGVDSFILLFQPVTGLTTSHLQEVKIKDALSMLITGFQRTIKLELEMNPGTSKEYQAALLDLLQEFQLLIKKTNERIGTIKNIPTA